jgi:prevent-host-death family protein
MPTYNIYEAKTNFSRLVEQAVNGEVVVIAKAGEPVLRMVPIASRTSGTKRQFGDNFLEITHISPDFYDDLPQGIFEVLGGDDDTQT